MTASFVVWIALEVPEPCWFERVEGRLVRTNAADNTVNKAVEDLFRVTPDPSSGGGEWGYSIGYQQRLNSWFQEPTYFGSGEELVRSLVREQTDYQGGLLRVEVLAGREMPTLVFVEHPEPDVASGVTHKIAAALAGRGATER